MPDVAPALTAAQSRSRRKGIAVASIGAVVEWYDALLYAYLAVVFARVFFPADMTPAAALAATLGGLAIGFLMRPVGGLFFGWLGDRHGRKRSLTWTVTLMVIPMIGTTILPTYANWGTWAPITLIVFRMIQGFSTGGEYSGTLVYLSEDHTEGRRGRNASFAMTFAGVGIVLASAVATVLTLTLSQQALDSWGWRLGYLLGSIVVIVAVVMRRHLPETKSYEEAQATNKIEMHPVRAALRRHWRRILLIALISGYVGIVYFIVMTYLVSFLTTNIGINHGQAQLIGFVGALLYAITAYWMGWWSDVAGRKPLMIWSAIALLVLSIPGYLLLDTGNLVIIWGVSLVLLFPLLTFSGGFNPLISELLPTKNRNEGVNLGYNLGLAVLGSTAPALSQWLISITGVSMIPSVYLVFASIIILPFLIKLPETAFASREALDSQAEVKTAKLTTK